MNSTGPVGRPVGDHGATLADGTPIDTSADYVVGWKIDGGQVLGSIGNPHQDLVLVYQFYSVGLSRQQCEGMADLVRTVMVAVAPAGGHLYTLAGAGWVGVGPRRPCVAMSGERTDDLSRIE